MWKILYALFPDLEFMHLRDAAEKKHPDKLIAISKIAEHYIYRTFSDIGYARRAFAALDKGGEDGNN